MRIWVGTRWIGIVLTLIFCFWGLGALGGGEKEMREEIKIQYLSPYSANISSYGINRLHFEGFRVSKIVGDSSKYAASVNSLGSDLFLISKVDAPEVITLSVQGSDGRTIDLRLLVKDLKEGVILNIDAKLVSSTGEEKREEAAKMIEHMAAGKRGKYFVEERGGKNRIILNSHLVLTDYVSYRYGDLKAVGFEVGRVIKKRLRRGEVQALPVITKQEIAEIFDKVVAVGFKEGVRSKGKLFVVFNNRDGDA